ncbi:hypothetical protein [Micromonospora sp. SH-82]|uniref:hypothetical protein n=1 Tax=Micromonospora sp. SH-82 TaxID=3132938 RepID=UPI003EBADB02
MGGVVAKWSGGGQRTGTLVTKERRGREQIVYGNVTALRRASRLLAAYEQVWRDRIHAIDQLLTEDPGR